MMSSARAVKNIHYFFNVVLVACGTLYIVLGAIMLTTLEPVSNIEYRVKQTDLETIPIFTVVLGCIIIVVSFFGWLFAFSKRVCCSTTYAIFLFIIFCLQIIFVIEISQNHQEVLKSMWHFVGRAMVYNDKEHNYPMDNFQTSFNCCGLDNYLDYFKKLRPVPLSCCGNPFMIKKCPAEIYDSKPGCQGKFILYWDKNMDILCYSGIGIALMEFIAFIFACRLTTNLRNEFRRRLY